MKITSCWQHHALERQSAAQAADAGHVTTGGKPRGVAGGAGRKQWKACLKDELLTLEIEPVQWEGRATDKFVWKG